MNFSRGRGRGRGFNNNQSQNNAVQSPWSSTTQTVTSTATDRPGPKKENQSPKNKMIDMQSRYGKILDDMEASDSSDEEIHNEQIMSKLTKNFDSVLGMILFPFIFSKGYMISFQVLVVCCGKEVLVSMERKTNEFCPT